MTTILTTIDLSWILAKKGFQVRYKRALFGVAWALVQPIAQATVMAVVFSVAFDASTGIQHYPMYVLSGIFPWAFFAQGTTTSLTAALDNASLLKKVAVAKIVFPASAAGTAIIGFACGVPVLVAGAVLAHEASLRLLVLPVALGFEALLILGLGMLLGAFHPAFRDVRYLLDVVLTAAVYITPIAYDPAGRSPRLAEVLRWNPMTGVLAVFRWSLIGRPMDGQAVAISAAITAALVVLGGIAYHTRADEFADLV